MCNLTCIFEALSDILKWIYKERSPLLRWIVFGFSLLMAGAGVYLCGMSGYYIHRYYKFFLEAESHDFDSVFGILGTGIFLILFSLSFGTLGAYKKNIILLALFAFLSMSFFAAILTLYFLILHQPYITKELFRKIVRGLKLLYNSDDKDFYSEVHRFQREHECCGVFSFNDYVRDQVAIPQSCCKNQLQCDSEHGFKIYTRGCVTAVTENLHHWAPLLDFIARVVMILLSITIFLTIAYSVMRYLKKKRKEQPCKARISLIEVESESELAFYNYNLGHSNSYIIV